MSNLLIKVGSFVGNATQRTISGIGFQPELVIVKNIDNSYDTWFTTKEMPAGFSLPHRADSAGDSSHLNGITSDGFTVSSDAAVNGSGNTIQYICVKDNGAGVFTTFTYTGDATDGKAITLPFTPNFLFIKSNSNITGAEKFSYQTSSDPFVASNAISSVIYNGGADRTDLISISSVTTGKILLGNGSSSGGNLINVNAVAHYGYAFKNTTNYFTVFTYTGNGINNRAITTSFQPCWIHLRRTDNGAPAYTVSSEAVGYAQSYDASKYTGAINSITSTGFTVGTSADGNNSGSTFYGFAVVDTSTIITSTANPSFLLNFIS